MGKEVNVDRDSPVLLAKRRIRSATESSPEELTPQERKARQRERRKRSSRTRPRELGGPVRRAAFLAIPAAAVAIVVIVLVFFSPFAPPCIQLYSVPAQSGTPAFPPSDTTNFGQTWCSTATAVYHVHVLLTIEVGGASVPIFDRVGINGSYAGGYTCYLPIHTHDSSGTLHLESAWPYRYTLADFFSEWAESQATVDINSSYPSQPVNYTGSDLFGLPTGGSHSLILLVDGEISTQGPQLDLTELDNPPSPSPACLGEEYGTGHTVALVYQ